MIMIEDTKLKDRIYVLTPSGIHFFNDRKLAEEYARVTKGTISETEKI